MQQGHRVFVLNMRGKPLMPCNQRKARILLKEGKAVMVCMHRLVMGLVRNDGLRVDHIFHNTNDNRKEKLRLVTRSQNLMNSKMFKNNTSGYKGVYYNKKKKKWDAKITINQEDINLGRYANIEDAIEARRVAEEKYFKEYRYQC